jgi:hypothetical protein
MMNTTETALSLARQLVSDLQDANEKYSAKLKELTELADKGLDIAARYQGLYESADAENQTLRARIEELELAARERASAPGSFV